MEQLTFEVAARLQSRGHQVSVLTSRAGVAQGEPEQDNIIRSLFLQADIHYYSVRAFFLQRRAQEAVNLRELRRAIDLSPTGYTSSSGICGTCRAACPIGQNNGCRAASPTTLPARGLWIQTSTRNTGICRRRAD